MRDKSGISSILILLAMIIAHPAKTLAAGPATQWQNHAAILAAARTFLDEFSASQHEGRSKVKLGNIDSRLRVKACTTPLEAFMSPGGRTKGNTTVGVRCPDVGGWSLYVAARIDIFGPVLTARQPLARGTRIQPGDLELVERNLSNLPYGYYTDIQSIAGQVAKRTINTATVITPQLLQPPRLIKRGQHVTLIAETGPLKIRSSGTAMSDGKSGDLIRVKSVNSSRIVDGIVISEGVVKVTL